MSFCLIVRFDLIFKICVGLFIVELLSGILNFGLQAINLYDNFLQKLREQDININQLLISN